MKRRKSPTKGAALISHGKSIIRNKKTRVEYDNDDGDDDHDGNGDDSDDDDEEEETAFRVPMSFEQLTRECDVQFYTGFHSSETFKAIYEHVAPKAHVIYNTGRAKNEPVAMSRMLDIKTEFTLFCPRQYIHQQPCHPSIGKVHHENLLSNKNF